MSFLDGDEPFDCPAGAFVLAETRAVRN